MTTTLLKTPAAPDLVVVTVNGREIMLPKGRNLLQALLDAGHYVPHYCYHPSLSIAGNCRICLIEIEGRPKPEISCNMVVAPDLKIKTEGELVESCRKGMMEFLLVNHPLDCPICDRGGECMLQRYSMDYGWGHARTQDDRRRFVKPQFDPLIDIERNRCIMCTRCVRFSEEVGGEHTMAVFSRGDGNYIGTYENGPVTNLFSGNVIDICPVGCLTSKPFRFAARPWEMRQTPTTTRVGAGPITAWIRGGHLLRVTPPPRRRKGHFTIDEDTTQFISNETRFGSYYANNAERLLVPRVRRADGKMHAEEWPVAIAAAAMMLKSSGPEATAILAGERSTNEECFLLSKLARETVGTTLVDWRARFVSEAAAQAAGRAMAASDGDFDLLDRKAYASTVMINANLYETAPDIGIRLREAVRLGRTQFGTIDARTDEWFGKLTNANCIEQPEALAATLEKLADARGKSETLKGYEGIQNLLKAEQGLLVLGLDAAGGALNPALVPAALKLLAALGEGWHFLPVTAARNAKGAFACGAQSDRLPGGNAVPTADAPAAPAILELAAQGAIKTLLLHRCDELVHHPRRAWVEAALDKVENLIVVDVFPSWIVDKAAVVLPGTMFYENDGTMTDIDGTLRRMTLGSRPKGQAQEEWRILTTLIEAMSGKAHFRRAGDVFTALGEAWGAGAKIALEDFRFDAPGDESPQRTSLRIKVRKKEFKLHFSERASASPAAEAMPAPDKGLRLLWEQHCQGPDHLGSRSTEFDRLRPTPNVELNPADAARSGLAEGDWVLLEGGGDVPCQISFNSHLAEGLAFGAANVLRLALEDGAALPTISLKRTEAPVDAVQTVEEIGATA